MSVAALGTVILFLADGQSGGGNPQGAQCEGQDLSYLTDQRQLVFLCATDYSNTVTWLYLGPPNFIQCLFRPDFSFDFLQLIWWIPYVWFCQPPARKPAVVCPVEVCSGQASAADVGAGQVHVLAHLCGIRNSLIVDQLID